MNEKYITYTTDANGITVVTLDRPEALNALNHDMYAKLDETIRTLSDSDSRVIILRGAGEKAFAAGTDIKMMQNSTPEENEESSQLIHGLLKRIESCPVPVIAVINGVAFGGGCELALACDMRFAASHAKIGLPETGLGIIPGGGGTQRLPRVVGGSRAKMMILTADSVDAKTALEIGLVDMVADIDCLMDETKKIALRIAAKSKVAVRNSKAAINIACGNELDPGLEFEKKCFKDCMDSYDRKEGMSAFIEKRKPVFEDR